MIRLRGTEFNPNDAAGKIQITDPYVQDAIESIARRAELVGDGTPVGDYVRQVLKEKLDLWKHEAQNNAGGRTLTYSQPWGSNGQKKGTTVSLLHRPGLDRWQDFTCLNSLREVEPTVKLVIEDGGLDEVGSEAEAAAVESGDSDGAGSGQTAEGQQ